MLKKIPIHSSSLSLRDYSIYLCSLVVKPRRFDLHAIFPTAFDKKNLYGLPTGRHALWEFLKSADLQKGDEVLVAAYNFYVIVRLLVQRELKPVFVDIDPQTLCMDPEDLKRKISPKSRMVIVTHMFGNPADMPTILDICQSNKLKLFEDCAHAIGTKSYGSHVGSQGDGALFSFGIYKIINCFGGGMLASSLAIQSPADNYLTGLASFKETFIRFVFSLLMRPWLYSLLLYPIINISKPFMPGLYNLFYPMKDDPDYRFNENSRAPFKEFMPHLIFQQMQRLEKNIARRRDIVRQFKAALKDIKEITFLEEDKHGFANCAYFGFYVPDPQGLANNLYQKGIRTHPYEYVNCARLKQFSEFQAHNPQAEYAYQHLLRLPNYPHLKNSELATVVEYIKSYYHAKGKNGS